MTRFLSTTLAVCLAVSAWMPCLAASTTQPSDKKENHPVPAALNFKMKSIDGKEVDLANQYKGRVVLVVNVASRCGLTPQYKALEDLHKKYGSNGLSIAGFPANNFGAQEPGTDAEIKQFCTAKFNVDFDMYSKISVKGDDKHPLYKYLTEQDPIGKAGKDITWNFEKFLVGRDGNIVARFAPRIAPDDKTVIDAIERELAKK